jgi:hypothetical protein
VQAFGGCDKTAAAGDFEKCAREFNIHAIAMYQKFKY